MQVDDFETREPFVSVLKPLARGNLKQINQQGFYYTLTNTKDIIEHVTHHEKQNGKTYLRKFTLPVEDRTTVLTELEFMGIHAFSLFESTEGLCRYFKESYFRKNAGGILEQISAFFRDLPEGPNGG